MVEEAVVRYTSWIDGAPVAPETVPAWLDSIDPAKSMPWAAVADSGPDGVDAAVRAAGKAFRSPTWRDLSPTRRGRLLMRLADLIAEDAERLAAIETRDNGKLHKEMLGQLQTIPNWLYYYGGLADKVEGRVIPVDRPGILNYTLREPLGVVGAIVPWNSPLLLTAFKLAPALAAGNTVVVKPSEHTSASLLELMPLVEQAGFPRGVVNVVTGGATTGAALARHPGVAKLSFTGGTETGRRVAADAMSHFARVTLELGGKSPNIVFADADLDAAEAGVVAGIFAAGGQTCVAGSRAFVHASIHDAFAARLATRAAAIRVGDPMDATTQIGPVAFPAQLEKIAHYVDVARAEGADVLAGGARLGDGLFYPPTVIGGVRNDMRVAQEEIFGPVLSVMPFETEDEVVELANDSPYGLAAGVWTRDLTRAHRMAQRLEAGTVWINTYRALTFNSPFGGYKASGIGRENGIGAIDEYLQEKSVWVDLSNEISDPFVLKA